jgi:hypothetical protein
MTPVQQRVKQTGEEVAEQTDKACRAPHDVTLSGAFNALCSDSELGMIALFAI